MTMQAFKFCPQCATELAFIARAEDGGDKTRLRCPASDYTHWNNPVPVLAAVIEYRGQILLARNGVYILENMDTSELVKDKAWEFMFTLGASRITGGVQAIINPVAIR